jgi:hypothetical protein
MKYFKCGKCQTPYKLDETKFKTNEVTITCNSCGVKNKIVLPTPSFPIKLIAQSKEKVQQFDLKIGLITLGRKAQTPVADILIEDEYVSRKHASIYIEKKENKFFVSIEDNDSLNGTYNKEKNKFKAGVKYPFVPGDYFIVGLTKLSLKIN